ATAKKLCKKFGFELKLDAAKQPEKKNSNNGNEEDEENEVDPPESLKPRPPIVTFLGHVDHGKTSLQDRVRHTHVVEGEAGRITQHIGASTVIYNNKAITFIDTPGHEAFTNMRARGANATDIAILVVAANEGFKPQTVEALKHAKAANVPIIVAMNKIDLPDADPNKVMLHMQQNDLTCEEWGGDVGVIKVSAKTGEGIDALLERVLLESEILELKANPSRKAQAVVLESEMVPGLGPAANIMVQNGTLKVGDIALCGEFFGKIKALINDKGDKVKSAGPSTPVQVIGLSGIPNAGAKLTVCPNERTARQKADARMQQLRDNTLSRSVAITAEDLFSKLNAIDMKSLNIIIKSDVKGSGEAIEQSLKKLPSDKITTNVVMNSVGAITENDIMLAKASEAIVVGFHVKVNQGVNELAKKNNIEIRLYSIIYELLEDITDALTGKLEPERKEISLGEAKILQIFEMSNGQKICGCMVESGTVKVGAKARVYRRSHLIYNGEVSSLRRFQDDVKEVKVGLECGIKLDNFIEFAENDKIEIYDIELKKASL
ncbi:MAG: translation initiation factor IF-2, partial [Victivallaceae bacterium]